LEFEVVPFLAIAEKFIMELVKSQRVAHSDKELHYDQKRFNRFLPCALNFKPLVHLSNIEEAVGNKQDAPDK
jgi:hypothetical protein